MRNSAIGVNEKHNTYRIFWVSHSVEGTESHRELVDNIVISVVFCFDESSKSLLVVSAMMKCDQ